MLHLGDCVEVMAGMPENSVDAIVTDPPYGLEFMGKEWDRLGRSKAQEWHLRWSTEVLSVLKPGGHLVAFGGTRTAHRLVCAVEDAGFEIRDTLCWLYGSGFPKSLDVSKAIDKAAGAERVLRREGQRSDVRPFVEDQSGHKAYRLGADGSETESVTRDGQKWDGWGTALKPAHEPIVLARKPLSEKTVAANVLRWGTGAINVDGCRIETSERWQVAVGSDFAGDGGWKDTPRQSHPSGRWPANVVLDAEAARLLDEQSGDVRSSGVYRRGQQGPSKGPAAIDIRRPPGTAGFNDFGGASRFFYTAKASRSEREEGPLLSGLRNSHPTVKPVDLMRWLIRLVTPPGGTVLDPFLGSGTTGIAARLEGDGFIGIEKDAGYLEVARHRIESTDPLLVVRG